MVERAIASQDIADAMQRACAALSEKSAYLTELDQAVGDGDTGITLSRMADALSEYARTAATEDIGTFLARAGMAANKAAPSTLGTLLATVLMSAGKEAKGKSTLILEDLAAMFSAADAGVQQRGKAKLGDKTLVDALHPASEAFASAVEAGGGLEEASAQALQAAREGRDSVTPLQSKIGRASWVGERTKGQVDPGCAALVIILDAIAGHTE